MAILFPGDFGPIPLGTIPLGTIPLGTMGHGWAQPGNVSISLSVFISSVVYQ